jgi:hypothetical protein
MGRGPTWTPIHNSGDHHRIPGHHIGGLLPQLDLAKAMEAFVGDDANDGMPPDNGAAQVGDLHGSVLFHRRESCRREQLAADIGNDLPLALRLVPGPVPCRIGDESRPFRLTLGQRFPGEEIGEAIAVFANRRGEKPGLADAMPLPDGQRLVGKALEQSRQPARQAVIDAVRRSWFRPFFSSPIPWERPTRMVGRWPCEPKGNEGGGMG